MNSGAPTKASQQRQASYDAILEEFVAKAEGLLRARMGRNLRPEERRLTGSDPDVTLVSGRLRAAVEASQIADEAEAFALDAEIESMSRRGSNNDNIECALRARERRSEADRLRTVAEDRQAFALRPRFIDVIEVDVDAVAIATIRIRRT